MLVAAISTGIKAEPISEDGEILARQSNAAYFLNGDFSAPLKGTWNIIISGNPPPNFVSRVKNNGNYVLQVKGLESCDEEHAAGSYLQGTIVDVVGGQTYSVTFDYKFSAKTKFTKGIGFYVTHGRTSSNMWTKNAKANQWYTFSLRDVVGEGRSGNQTFSVNYINCPNGHGEDYAFPTVQFDNFHVQPVG